MPGNVRHEHTLTHILGECLAAVTSTRDTSHTYLRRTVVAAAYVRCTMNYACILHTEPHKTHIYSDQLDSMCVPCACRAVRVSGNEGCTRESSRARSTFTASPAYHRTHHAQHATYSNMRSTAHAYIRCNASILCAYVCVYVRTF